MFREGGTRRLCSWHSTGRGGYSLPSARFQHPAPSRETKGTLRPCAEFWVARLRLINNFQRVLIVVSERIDYLESNGIDTGTSHENSRGHRELIISNGE